MRLQFLATFIETDHRVRRIIGVLIDIQRRFHRRRKGRTVFGTDQPVADAMGSAAPLLRVCRTVSLLTDATMPRAMISRLSNDRLQ